MAAKLRNSRLRPPRTAPRASAIGHVFAPPPRLAVLEVPWYKRGARTETLHMVDSVENEVRKFDAYARDYDGLHAANIAASGESPVYFAQYKRDCLLRLGVSPNEPLLDFGCGIGNVTEQLAGVFTNVHGFDPSKDSIAFARSRLPQVTFYADRSELPRGFFKTAILSGVLHHVPKSERVALLEEVREHLQPGGRVVVFEHNPINPVTRHAVATCPFDDDAVLLWPWEVTGELRRAGFQRLRRDYIVFFPKRLAVLRRLEPRLRWLALGAQTMTTGLR